MNELLDRLIAFLDTGSRWLLRRPRRRPGW
jgi:hypothetical protein